MRQVHRRVHPGFPVKRPERPARILNPRFIALTALDLYEECVNNPSGATGLARVLGCSARTLRRHITYSGDGRGPRLSDRAARELHRIRFGTGDRVKPNEP